MLQLSLAVGAVQLAIALQEDPAVSVMSLGHFAKTGAVWSLTTTVKLQFEVLPLWSLAV